MLGVICERRQVGPFSVGETIRRSFRWRAMGRYHDRVDQRNRHGKMRSAYTVVGAIEIEIGIDRL